MRRAWKAAASAVTLLAALVACSGGSDGASETSSVLVTTTASTSTTVPVSSSTSSPSTTSTTIATTSSLAPTTTTTLATTTTVSPEEQVAADYRQLYEQYWICLRSPATCDPSALTASVGPARAALTKTLADLVAGELFAGDEDPGYLVVESIDFSDSTTAVVLSCWWDTGVLYGPPAQPGGAPLIINNLQVTSRFGSTMKLEGGRWVVSEEQRVSRVEGVNECPPEN